MVTGGSRGIGAATVLSLARAGHDIVFSYRADSDAADRVRIAATNHGIRSRAIKADVTDEADVERLFGAAAEIGTTTGLVNNAGLTANLGDLADTPVEVIRNVIDVNLSASSCVPVRRSGRCRLGAAGAVARL